MCVIAHDLHTSVKKFMVKVIVFLEDSSMIYRLMLV